MSAAVAFPGAKANRGIAIHAQRAHPIVLGQSTVLLCSDRHLFTSLPETLIRLSSAAGFDTGFPGGSGLLRGWSHDKQDNEQVLA